MRSPLTLPGLLAILLLAFTLIGGTGAAAQNATPDDLQPEDLTGLQHSVVRAYTVDYSAMLDVYATPGAEIAMPSGVLTLGATILEFDNAENAETALGQLQDEASDGILGENAEIAEIDLELGDNGTAYSSVEEFEGQELETILAVVQQDTYVYFVVGAGSELDMQSLVSDFAITIIETDGSGAGELNQDGTYSGGLWDKFSAVDDDLVAGLIPFDSVIYPEPESTPAP